MANVDRPNGFRPVKTFSGAPWTAMVRSTGVADGEDIFVGDIVNLESGLADPGATNDADFLGVAVGFAKKDSFSQEAIGGNFNPSDLTVRYYDDSANTHTDWIVYFVPVNDVIFEAQTNAANTFVVGDAADLVDAAGDAVTGVSRQEIGASTNADFVVVEIPKYPDNDPVLANGRYWVAVTRAEQAFHA